MKRLVPALAAASVLLASMPAHASDERLVPRQRFVTVRPGDTLSELASGWVGGPYRAAWVNRDRIEHPDLIEVGVVLKVPRVDGKRWVPRPPIVVASRTYDRGNAAPQRAQRRVSAAPSAAGDVWTRLAACESGGNWSANTGNGYYGGLQHSLSTWRAFGGNGYPHEQSAAAQIAVATRVQASQGWGAWPACSQKLGLR